MSRKAPFQYIDEFVFKQVEEIRNKDHIVGLRNSLSILPDAQRKIVNYLITFGFLLIPVLATMIYGFIIYSHQSTIDTKKEIIEVQRSIQGKRSLLNGISQSLVSKTNLASEADLKKLVSTALAASKGHQVG